MRVTASELDRVVRIERPEADTSLNGAGSGSWVTVQDGVPAGIRDVLPSRGERLTQGVTTSSRPARVRMRFRSDITPAMRLVEVVGSRDGRIMQIVSMPAELGRRDGIEFMVEEYSPAGNPA